MRKFRYQEMELIWSLGLAHLRSYEATLAVEFQEEDREIGGFENYIYQFEETDPDRGLLQVDRYFNFYKLTEE